MYRKVPPPGNPIPINVEPFDVEDDCLEDVEIRAAVKQLRSGRTGGASKMKAEDIKEWLRGVIEDDDNVREGTGDKW